MDVVPESVSQPIDYVRRLSSAGLELPSAIEVVLMLFLHYAGTKEQLLLRKHTWCSDHASLGRHVTVGAFGRNGISDDNQRIEMLESDRAKSHR